MAILILSKNNELFIIVILGNSADIPDQQKNSLFCILLLSQIGFASDQHYKLNDEKTGFQFQF